MTFIASNRAVYYSRAHAQRAEIYRVRRAADRQLVANIRQLLRVLQPTLPWTATQTAIYLARIVFGMSLRRCVIAFGAHGRNVKRYTECIEDARDDAAIDVALTHLEEKMLEALG